MPWLVITILLALATIGAAIFGVRREIRMGVPALAVVVWLLISIFFSIHTVGQREVGIVYNFSGTISGNASKSPGVVTTWPWQNIRKENVAIQKETFVFAGSDSAVSKDQQPITATLIVNYQVEPQHVVGLYKSIGPNWKSVLLDGRVPQDFKETTAQFTSPEITLNRPALRKITVGRLRDELGKYDVAGRRRVRQQRRLFAGLHGCHRVEAGSGAAGAAGAGEGRAVESRGGAGDRQGAR